MSGIKPQEATWSCLFCFQFPLSRQHDEQVEIVRIETSGALILLICWPVQLCLVVAILCYPSLF